MNVNSRRVAIAGLLVAAALIWVLVDGPVEGPTLLVLGHGHGVTVADLASVVAVVFAAAVLLTGRRRTPRQRQRG